MRTTSELLAARRRISQPTYMVFAAVLAAAAIYLVEPPPVPDLAAQVARMNVARGGGFLFWTGWFGGLNLPSYSPITPVVMSWLGVGVTAVLAAITTIVAGTWLLRGTRRPGLGLAAFTLTVLVDMFCGRVTFALGFAVAVVALALLRGHRPVLATATGLVACLASPLAGLFLGLVALAVAAADRSRRTSALVLAVALLALGVILDVVSPGTGQMPYPWWHMVVGEVIVAAIAVMCPQRVVRASCAALGLAILAFFVAPEAVGTNVIRLEWLAAAPVAVACADMKRLRVVRYVPLAVPVFGLLSWPLADMGYQLAVAGEPTTSQTFYQPLLGELHQQVAADGPAATGERVEVVQSASQWSAAYVAAEFPLARGWDRQVDRADNPLFYNGSLTSRHYYHWLSQLAVGWVALPRRGALDYAATDEAAVVRQHPTYLRLAWQDRNWELYRVVGAHPLIRGASLVSIGSDRLTMQTATAGPARLQLRWSPYLTLTRDGQAVAACITARGPWTTVWLPGAGTYTLTAHFSLNRSAPQSCEAQPAS